MPELKISDVLHTRKTDFMGVIFIDSTGDAPLLKEATRRKNTVPQAYLRVLRWSSLLGLATFRKSTESDFTLPNEFMFHTMHAFIVLGCGTLRRRACMGG